MKIALAAEIMTPIQQIHEEIAETDNEKTIAEKIFRSNVRTLENTLQILESNAIEKAVKLLMKADKVQFLWHGRFFP